MTDTLERDSWWLRMLRDAPVRNPSPLSGQTDEGIRYRVLRSPDEAPPVILECQPPPLRKWNEQSAQKMVGQAFGMRWAGKVLMLRVVGGSYNPVTRRLELHCK